MVFAKASNMSASDEFREQREHMVHMIQRQGVSDPRVCQAMLAVRREIFVPQPLQEHAYDDSALPIGLEQTISQPYIVALMASKLELSPADRVLEVGAGSGYASAVLAQLCGEVYAIERLPDLAEQAWQRIHAQGISNVHVRTGDGTLGWPDHAPFDAISVAAGGPSVPHALLEQLAIGGRLIMPVGSEASSQQLQRIWRLSETSFRGEELCHVRFVPLVGAQGWRG
jgi:protein-L-isoaspartate(D-aspartate) O-methyltransferase